MAQHGTPRARRLPAAALPVTVRDPRAVPATVGPRPVVSRTADPLAPPLAGSARPGAPRPAARRAVGPRPAASVEAARRERGPAGLPATSGRILVAAVAAGAMIPAVQTLGTHVADAESTSTQLSRADLALAAHHGVARSTPSAPTAVDGVTTVAMPLLDAPTTATGVSSLAKAASVARENGPLRFGTPYVAGDDRTLDGQIAKALGLLGLPQRLAPGVKTIIMRESTGNPDAVNNWDSNAAAGTPSKGLMQVIDATFHNAVLPSLADRGIYDPVANITAGIRTMVANHGIDAVMAGGRHDAAGDYIGYGGGKLPSDGLGLASRS